jgi:hypothetical protein
MRNGDHGCRVVGLAPFALAFTLVQMGCGAASTRAVNEQGQGAVRLTLPSAALASEVVEVIVTTAPGDGPAFAAFEAQLSMGPGGWNAVLSGVPAGPGRLFEVSANDAAHTPRYAGAAKADVVAGQVSFLVVTLGPTGAPPVVQGSAPVIDAVSASQSAVGPGATVRLEVTAHDPDPLDSISISWSATAGSFDDATRAVVTWTAPSAPGPCQISVRVSDLQGSSVTVYLGVDVAAPLALAPGVAPAGLAAGADLASAVPAPGTGGGPPPPLP